MTSLFICLADTAAAILLSLTTPEGDKIPDFSRVGYRWGDKEIPSVKVVKTIAPPSDGTDASKLLQEAINTMKTPGALLLKAGTYNLSENIYIKRSGVVIRGEGEGTVLRATGTTQRKLLNLGSGKKSQKADDACWITDKYTPCGSEYVTVSNPERFKEGQGVFIFRPGSEQWIHDIHMDRIDEIFNNYGVAVENWQAKDWKMFFERRVSRIDGNRLYLDSPVVMALDASRYGRGKVVSMTWERVSECGIENLVIESEYDPEPVKTRVYNGVKETYPCDERHCMTGITVTAAEHCWIRNVRSRYLGMSLVYFGQGARNITVEDCHAAEPVSIIEGSRRYAFQISSEAALCLVRNCTCDRDRHCFVTNGPSKGPNVFLDCTATHAYEDTGPHMKWAMGTLYDRVVTDGPFDIQDRGASGHGHGMTGANNVLWNCEAASFIVQNPWASAANYAIGCIGPEKKSTMTSERPEGVWVSRGKHVEPSSLYEYQLAGRRKTGKTAMPKQCCR